MKYDICFIFADLAEISQVYHHSMKFYNRIKDLFNGKMFANASRGLETLKHILKNVKGKKCAQYNLKIVCFSTFSVCSYRTFWNGRYFEQHSPLVWLRVQNLVVAPCKVHMEQQSTARHNRCKVRQCGIWNKLGINDTQTKKVQ